MTEQRTVSVLICALNEEKNIGFLLEDLMKEQICEPFVLKNIYVVSDGSTDRTVTIVSEKQAIDTRIIFVQNEKRIGKIFSLEKMFKEIEDDLLVLFDADVRLEEGVINRLLTPFVSSNPLLVGGNPKPAKQSGVLNFAELASLFSWYLVDAIKKKNPNGIYSAHGRVLVLRKALYKGLNISETSTPGDDQAMFIGAKGDFMFVRDAAVYYKLPSAAGDYLKQNRRFRLAKSIKHQSYTEACEYFIIKNKFQVYFRQLLLHPLAALAWMTLYSYGWIQFQLMNKKSKYTWEEIKSSK